MSPAPSPGVLAAAAGAAAPAAEFELLLFGAPRVLHRGSPLYFGSRKALTILALLALDGGATRERLAAWLWPQADASAARRNLRRDLFRLRELQLPLSEQADGHLALAPGWFVDVLAFREAVARADEARALALASASLFEGLDGVADAQVDHWLAEQRAAVLRLRDQARSALARARTEQGDDETALALWSQALDEDPCHEAALLPAMALLARRGDRAGALALYERTRQALREQLGVDAAAPVQALAQGLRSGEHAGGGVVLPVPGRDAGRSAPGGAGASEAASAAVALAPRLAARAPFVGRAALVRQVQEAWAAGRRVVLAGVPGVGKTRLACECAAAAGAWLRLSCRPLDAAEPFCTAVNAMRALRDAAPELELPAWVRRELAQLMPEFGAAPEHTGTVDQAARLRQAFGEGLSLLAAENFEALVLDDWHWCDADSRLLLDALGRGGGLRCIFTFRSGELPAAAERQLLDDIDRGAASRFEVQGLAADDTEALLRALLPASSPPAQGAALATRLHEATQGHPLHLLETLRHLDERQLLQAPGAALALPPTVRETVLARVRALGEAPRRLLEAASLLGGGFDPAWLDLAGGGLVEGGPSAVVAVLERAEAARLIAAEGGRYRFDHDLLRQCLADSLSPARRAWLHHRLAESLADRGAAPALVAIQFEQAGQGREAVPWRMRAGAEATRRHALAEAARHYAFALADQPEAAAAVQAQLELYQIHQRTGDRAAAAEAVAAAVAAAAGADAASAVEARLTCAEHWAATERGADALGLLESMAPDLAAAGAVAQARAQACAGVVHSRAGRFQQAQEHQRQAVALLESAPGGLQRLARLLLGQATHGLASAQPAAAEAAARRALTAFEASAEQGGAADALGLLAVARMHQGDRGPETVALLHRGREIARACGNVPAQRRALANLYKLAADAGALEEAATWLDEAFALAPGFETPAAELHFLQYRFHLHWMRAEHAEAEAATRRSLEVARQLDERRLRVLPITVLAEICISDGRLAEADELLQEAHAALAGTDLGPMHVELPRLRARWLLRAGQPEEADAAWRRIPAARLNLWEDCTVAALGAEIALAAGDAALARQRLAAVRMPEAPSPQARAILLAQEMAVARAAGEPGTALRDEAQALLGAGRLPRPSAQALSEALQRFTHGVATPR